MDRQEFEAARAEINRKLGLELAGDTGEAEYSSEISFSYTFSDDRLTVTIDRAPLGMSRSIESWVRKLLEGPN